MDISKLTPKQLRDLANKKEREQRKAGAPKQIQQPDLTALREICQSKIDHALGDGEDRWDNEDHKQYVYECAMETIFGNGVFDWLNAQDD